MIVTKFEQKMVYMEPHNDLKYVGPRPHSLSNFNRQSPAGSIALLVILLAVRTASGATNDVDTALQRGLFEEEANHNLQAAVQAYQAVIARFDQDRKMAATAVFRLAECYRKQGQTNEANAQYERVVREFGDQLQLVGLSRERLPSAAQSQLLTLDTGPAASSDEANEIKSILAMIQNSPDLINARDPNGATPLHNAAQKGQLVVAKFLLTNGADVEAKDRTRAEKTPLQVAAAEGNAAMVELLLNHKAKINAANSAGNTALHFATDHGFKNVVELLLARGAEVSTKHTFGATPLHDAIANGYKAVAEVLLSHGAEVNGAPALFQLNDQTYRGMPLHVAAQRGDAAATEMLLTHKADVNALDQAGQTPLHLAAAGGHTSVASLLLAHGAQVDPKRPGDGGTPLLAAVEAGQKEMVSLLLENKAEPNVRKSGNWTLLMMAASQSSIEILNLLLATKADPNLKSSDGNYSASMAALDSRDRAARCAMVTALVGREAKVDDRDANGETPLMKAVKLRDKDTLAALLKAKLDVNATDRYGNSALLLLIYSLDPGRRFPVPGQILALPGRIPVPGQSTPEQIEPGAEVPGMVEMLISAGANVNLQDYSGSTPLQYLESSKLPGSISAEVVKLLKKHGAVKDLPDFSSIRVTRAGGGQFVSFRADTSGLNSFTLMEVIQNLYLGPANNELSFPDFSRVKILRPLRGKLGERNSTVVNLLTGKDSFDCVKDVRLEFGDIVEIPEREHPLSDPRVGLTQPQRMELENCLKRAVTFQVKGQSTEATLNGNEMGTYLSRALSLPDVQRFLRSSSDFSHLTVKRTEPGTGTVKDISADVLPFWNGQNQMQNDLWLRAGDVVVVPDKP
jgi:ankyrin repeat protein